MCGTDFSFIHNMLWFWLFFICFAHDWWGRGCGKLRLSADWGPCIYWKPRDGAKLCISNLAPFLAVWLTHPVNHSLVFAHLQNNCFVRACVADVRRAPCIFFSKPSSRCQSAVKRVFSAFDALTCKEKSHFSLNFAINLLLTPLSLSVIIIFIPFNSKNIFKSAGKC